VPIVALAGARLVAGHHLAISGWRWLLVIGGLGAFVLWMMRRRLPESPRWLASHGREEEPPGSSTASRTRCAPQRAPSCRGRGVPEEPLVRLPLTSMFGATYRRRTVMLWIFQVLQTVGYYGFGSLAPIVLVSKGYSVVDSLGYAALSYIGYPIGSALSIPLMERCERKSLIIGSALGIAAFGVVFGAAANTALIVFADFCLRYAATYSRTRSTCIRRRYSHPYSQQRDRHRILVIARHFRGATVYRDFGAGPSRVHCGLRRLRGAHAAVVPERVGVGPYTTGRSLEQVNAPSGPPPAGDRHRLLVAIAAKRRCRSWLRAGGGVAGTTRVDHADIGVAPGVSTPISA